MADNNISEQLRQLQAAVESLTRRISLLEGAPQPKVLPTSIPVAATPSPSSPAVTTRTASSSTGLRVFLAILGIVFLGLGSFSVLFNLAGLGLIILAIFWPWGKKTVTRPIVPATTSAVAAKSITPAPAVRRQPGQFEQDLAKHWFSWLGIISLVVGITLLLGYALRGYGPAGRIMTGYAAAAMLFGITAWFWKPYRTFAMVLESGAWAIVYVSTYALHTVAGHPVASPLLGGILLLAVVSLIAAAALWQRSRALTAGAFLLGYIAAVTNSVDVFTLAAMVFLAVGLVAIASYKRWPDFILIGTIATYLVQFAWMAGLGNRLELSVTTGAIFLISEVVIFGLAHWLTSATTSRHQQMVVAGTVANLLGFFWLLQYLISVSNSANGWMATLFIAVVCGLLAGLTRLWPTRRYLQTVYIVFAISFFTLGLAQHWKGDTLTLAWLIEAGVLLCIGLWSGPRSVRYMGYVVSVFALGALSTVLLSPATMLGTTGIHSRLVLGLLGAIIFGTAAAISRAVRARLPAKEKYAPAVLADVALAVLLVMFAQELPVAWVPIAWSAIAILAVAIGAQIRSLNSRVVGYVLHVLTLYYWLANVAPSQALAGSLAVHSRLLSGVWIVLLSGLSAWLVRRKQQTLRAEENLVSQGLWWLTTISLTIVLGTEVAKGFISIAWGLEGIALYLVGFAQQSISARRQGLAVIGLTIAKVYVYDVQTLSTPNRILSFIILGILLLVIGYLYNRWRQKSKSST